ncbi:hypothetical protein IEQ34_011599 [Dendrobium chrysotoxum]|uniref:Uncharacterized protein n=1 Tax=Dendrobium chrysotoxum TaxID=161865 RepID=A0AAV7GR61_DENCH|nr:hypothetical protein IEQ34_011599 [Dendrobium chrysotoxum]
MKEWRLVEYHHVDIHFKYLVLPFGLTHMIVVQFVVTMFLIKISWRNARVGVGAELCGFHQMFRRNAVCSNCAKPFRVLLSFWTETVLILHKLFLPEAPLVAAEARRLK